VQPAQLIASVCSLPNLLWVWAACPTHCECGQPAQLIVIVGSLLNLLWVWAACPTYCECVQPAQHIARVCSLPNLLQVCAACPTYCECVQSAQLIASVCSLPNLLWVWAACPTPRLSLSFELRPSWNNIHDTSPTGTAQVQQHYVRQCLLARLVSLAMLRKDRQNASLKRMTLQTFSQFSTYRYGVSKFKLTCCL
jgi:hypothetical protein